VKFGVYVSPFRSFAHPRALAELAREAEDAGWEGFFIYDHVARPGLEPVADAWIALSAIAMATERVRIGALVTPLARRRPWKVARETVSLDQLSAGRLVLGVGLGHRPEEFEAFGDEASPRTRAAMLDEGLEVVTKLWSGRPVDHQGHFYRVAGATFVPTPVQRPRIPIWVGGRWPHAGPLRRAARWDGVFPLAERSGTLLGPAEIRGVVEAIGRYGPVAPGFDVVHMGRSGEPGDPDTMSGIEAAGATWWLEDIRPSRYTGHGSAWPGDAMRDRIRRGPPKGH
jgi:alkanesulfonate monooxygenase SsuD/methylene tetrahydromethanopterin reductase-like flavin-dependent oxidoreductase (luciferase family)